MKTGLRLLWIVIFAITLNLGANAWAANLHVVFVIDSDDETIGRMVVTDLKLMEKEIKKISRFTGLKLRKQLYMGDDFKVDTVGNAISDLKVGSDDVILFYYSGHGFRTGKKRAKWPFFFFKSEKTLDYGWVIQELRGKGARLTITLTDACNNVVDVDVVEDDKFRAKAASMKDMKGYKTLFLKYKGYINATSSKPGETSTATRDGSLFTLSFLKALHREVKDDDPDWNPLMKRGAGEKLYLEEKYKHTPFYEMRVAKVGGSRNRSRRRYDDDDGYRDRRRNDNRREDPPRRRERPRPENPVDGELGDMLGGQGW